MFAVDLPAWVLRSRIYIHQTQTLQDPRVLNPLSLQLEVFLLVVLNQDHSGLLYELFAYNLGLDELRLNPRMRRFHRRPSLVLGREAEPDPHQLAVLSLDLELRLDLDLAEEDVGIVCPLDELLVGVSNDFDEGVLMKVFVREPELQDVDGLQEGYRFLDDVMREKVHSEGVDCLNLHRLWGLLSRFQLLLLGSFFTKIRDPIITVSTWVLQLQIQPPMDPGRQQLEQVFKHISIKQKSGYSGGYKQLSKPQVTQRVLVIKEPPTKQDIYRQFGIIKTKDTDIEEILPHRDKLPKTKEELITMMIENVEHKLNKIRYQREANIYF